MGGGRVPRRREGGAAVRWVRVEAAGPAVARRSRGGGALDVRVPPDAWLGRARASAALRSLCGVWRRVGWGLEGGGWVRLGRRPSGRCRGKRHAV